MSANSKNTAPVWIDPDEVPDLTSLEWAAVVAATPVQRGRPKAAITKIATTIRLDPEVLARFKAAGPGWQSRINEALRHAAGL